MKRGFLSPDIHVSVEPLCLVRRFGRCLGGEKKKENERLEGLQSFFAFHPLRHAWKRSAYMRSGLMKRDSDALFGCLSGVDLCCSSLLFEAELNRTASRRARRHGPSPAARARESLHLHLWLSYFLVSCFCPIWTANGREMRTRGPVFW